MAEQLQSIERILNAIAVMMSIFGPFACCMLFLIFTVLVFKK